VIDPADAAMIHGFMVNKFRGDPALFDDGYRAIEARTGWRGFGVVPWLTDAAQLPSEDAVVLQRPVSRGEGRVVIACPITAHIANFDDLDPLRLEPSVELVMVRPGEPIPAEAALIVIAGSKATIADLAFFRKQGWDIDVLAHHRQGKPVLGLCGGYQMLGQTLADPDGVEGPAGTVAGLGLLAVDTVLTGSKALVAVSGTAGGAPFSGYEMHMGRTTGPDTARAAAVFADGRRDGAVSADRLVTGSYIHGLLGDARQRATWLARIGAAASGPDHGAAIDAALDSIADMLERHVDVDGLIALSAMGGNRQRE
jgi:adenosylcobyric acid synthase